MVVLGGVLTKDLVVSHVCVHVDVWCYMCDVHVGSGGVDQRGMRGVWLNNVHVLVPWEYVADRRVSSSLLTG